MVATSNIGLSADQPGADSPVLQELNRLHQGGLSAMPAPLGKTISALGVLQSLTGQQQSDLQGIRGQEYVSQINSLMQSPEYQKLTDADKAEAIKKVQTIVDTQTNIKYAASNDLQQTDQGGIELNHTQQDAQYKLQAANAYQHSDGAAYHALISKLPPAQQVTVADEIRAAFGDTVYGKQDSAAAQVIKSMQPPVAGLDAGQVGAVNYVNNPSSFQNRRLFEQSNPDRDPIYDLPDEQARQVLLARSQSVDGQSTPLAKYIKDAPWYKSYAVQESAYFDAHPQPAQVGAIQNPLMSPTQKAAAAQLDQLTTPSDKSAFYNTPAGQDLQNFYKSLSQVNAQKLERMGATAGQVAVAQQASAFQSQDITKAIAAIANGTAGTAAAFKSGSSSRRISAGAKRAGASLGQVSKPRGSSSKVRSVSFHAPSGGKLGIIARPPSYKVSKTV